MTKGDLEHLLQTALRFGQNLSTFFSWVKFRVLKDATDAEIAALQAPRSAFEPADLLQNVTRFMCKEPQLHEAANRDPAKRP